MTAANTETINNSKKHLGVKLGAGRKVTGPGIYIAKTVDVTVLTEVPLKIEIAYELTAATGQKSRHRESFICTENNGRWQEFGDRLFNKYGLNADMDFGDMIGLEEVVEIVQNGSFLNIVQRDLKPKDMKPQELEEVQFVD